MIDNYAIKGHVPVKDIARLLDEKPKNNIELSNIVMLIDSSRMFDRLYREVEPFVL
jgi:hypothetical protein